MPLIRFPHDHYLLSVLQIMFVVRETLQAFPPAKQVELLDLSTLQLSSES